MFASPTYIEQHPSLHLLSIEYSVNLGAVINSNQNPNLLNVKDPSLALEESMGHGSSEHASVTPCIDDTPSDGVFNFRGNNINQEVV